MYYEEEIDLYSNSKRARTEYNDISSHSKRPSQGKKRRRKKKKHIFRRLVIFLLCLIFIFGGGFYIYAYKMIDKIERSPLDTENLGIGTNQYDGMRNIALLGIDSREDNDTGRSDAVVIVTVDKKHKKIKLTSIARDTYVTVEGHNKDKLTHAYAYGKSQLAVKTLNQNFGLEITDYVTMNFFKVARIIDFIGGVTLDVDEREMNELNKNIFIELQGMGYNCPNLTEPGIQKLNGFQAVCYARIRHTDSDIMRGNRQKEVLMAMFSEVKKMNPIKLPKVAEMIVSECKTSLSTNDIISMGAWAVALSPKFEQLSVPNDNIPSRGKTIKGTWYYVYDLETAEKEIHDYIFEENYYSPENVAKRVSESE